MLVKNGRVPGFELALIPTHAFHVFLRDDIEALIGKNKVLRARVHWPIDEKTAVVDINPAFVDYRIDVGDLQIFGAGVEKLAL